MAAIVGASTWISIDLTRAAGSVSTVWIVSGIVVGVLLFQPFARWPATLAAAFAAELVARILHGDPMARSFVPAIANLLEIVLIAGAIRRRVPDITDPARLFTLATTATGSTLVACGISALLVATYAAIFRDRPFVEILLTWYTAHVIGMVIVATLVVVARRERSGLLGRPGKHLDFALCAFALLGICAAVFLQDRAPLLFLVLAPLLLLTFRHGFAGVVSGVVVIAVTAGISTALDAGPFALLKSSSLLAHTFLLQAFVGTCCLVAFPVATVLSERKRFAARYRTLADYSRDLVVRMSAEGAPSYVSPAIRHVLGYEPEEFLRARWDLVNPDDIAQASEAFQRIAATGISEPVTFRIRHKEGHEIWVEVACTRVLAVDSDARWELIASARDISKRMEAIAALDDSRARLRAITDNIPALIAHVDADERYSFVNAQYERIYGVRTEDLLGKTVREARGEEAYRTWSTHIQAAISGREQIFDREPDASTGFRYLQSHYVPDIAPDGARRGFYALTFDITPLKEAERALDRLARVDALTSLGNRREFDERLERAISRAKRHGTPLLLMLLDLDKFKAINDTFGHPAGDAVLRSFATRLASCVRDVDSVARLGGDEFAVLVEDAQSPEAAEAIAKKLIVAMQEPVDAEGHALHVGTSIGIAYTTNVASARALTALADKALYDAKAGGRNTWRLIVD
ncbi:diguanylate cyclase [Lysobacter sp. KIS68-7]|uniref:sensor domain-containing diguanylate cyclase n=1 Tax=Lysobacter sp. KIS68-7 TaxID=2904252 RepID=UPI001E4B571C|nr:sensor domain-containing diguanylate cyclase [Lysobacter sp. KIS68-7]UHQ18951.1 diguanylate cyclase [Lysobacter sp. KIS68-7]